MSGERPPRDPASFRDRSLGYQINLAARLLAQELAARIAPLGVAPGQFPILIALGERDGQTQTELARAARVEQPTMANTLKRMERDGLVERRPDPKDPRRRLVSLTERGRAVLPQAMAAGAAINADLSARLGPERGAALLDGLRALVAALAKDDA